MHSTSTSLIQQQQRQYSLPLHPFYTAAAAAAVSSSSSSTAQEGPDLLLHPSYTAAAAAVSSSSSFVTQHSFPVQPAGICPLFLSPQLHLPSNENVNLVVGSMTRADHLIASHLIPPNPPEMSYTTQLSDIKQSCVQIPPPN